MQEIPSELLARLEKLERRMEQLPPRDDIVFRPPKEHCTVAAICEQVEDLTRWAQEVNEIYDNNLNPLSDWVNDICLAVKSAHPDLTLTWEPCPGGGDTESPPPPKSFPPD